MKYALFDMPLESIHGQAFRAAQAARCAGEQGKYWEMRTRLFANPTTLTDAGHARAIGLDQGKFDACIAAGRFVDDIRRDISQAQAAGVDGTPSFMLATTGPGGQLKVLRVFRGAQPFPAFKAAIDAALAQQ